MKLKLTNDGVNAGGGAALQPLDKGIPHHDDAFLDTEDQDRPEHPVPVDPEELQNNADPENTGGDLGDSQNATHSYTPGVDESAPGEPLDGDSGVSEGSGESGTDETDEKDTDKAAQEAATQKAKEK